MAHLCVLSLRGCEVRCLNGKQCLGQQSVKPLLQLASPCTAIMQQPDTHPATKVVPSILSAMQLCQFVQVFNTCRQPMLLSTSQCKQQTCSWAFSQLLRHRVTPGQQRHGAPPDTPPPPTAFRSSSYSSPRQPLHCTTCHSTWHAVVRLPTQRPCHPATFLPSVRHCHAPSLAGAPPLKPHAASLLCAKQCLYFSCWPADPTVQKSCPEPHSTFVSSPAWNVCLLACLQILPTKTPRPQLHVNSSKKRPRSQGTPTVRMTLSFVSPGASLI